jgi:hypothetical protein
MHHPQVGDLELQYDKFAVTGAEDQLMVIYHAEPATRSAQALSLLASLSDQRASATFTQ